MATLKELMGDKVRGEGRKFGHVDWEAHEWFEPIFYAVNHYYGLNQDGIPVTCEANRDGWLEWHPPKKTKKVKMYKPIYKTILGQYYSLTASDWNTEKKSCGDVAGWLEMEVEVEE